MRTYLRSVGYYSSVSNGLMEIDLTDLPLKEVFNYYKNITIVIYDSIYKVYESIDLNDYYNEINLSELTIEEWLLTKDSVALKTSSKLPPNTESMVTCYDVEYVGYRWLPADLNKSLSVQEHLTPRDCNDIRLVNDTRKIDYKTINKKCLFNMNGCFVRSYSSDDGIYIRDGGKHYRKYDFQSHIQMMLFENVSNLETIDITEDMVNVFQTMEKTRVYLNYKESLENKVVWLVLCGHLIMNDTFIRLNDKSFEILKALSTISNLLFETREYIDISKIINDDVHFITEDQLNGKKFINKVLTDNSSFLIVFDNTDMGVETIPVETRQYPSCFVTPVKEKLPLRLMNGLFPSYVERPISSDRLLEIDIRTKNRYVGNKAGYYDDNHYDHDTQERYRPLLLSKAKLIKIRSMYYDENIKEKEIE